MVRLTWHGAADIACGVANIRHGVADMAHGAADEYHFFLSLPSLKHKIPLQKQE